MITSTLQSNTQNVTNLRIPWFRSHIVLLNDPGRLISVHIVHSALVSGWSGLMMLYEIILIDPSDPVYNPIWRQGSFVIPFASRLGVVASIDGWSIGNYADKSPYWGYETVSVSHLALSGLLIISSFFHWAYWDLDLFLSQTGKLALDLNRIFGIHLLLASLVCFGFGLAHLSGYFGPGFWTSDSAGLLGSIRFVKPVYSINSLTSFSYGVVPSNHIVAGFVGCLVSLWHISSRPGPTIFKWLTMSNIEAVLSSSISAVFFIGFITSATMWYGSVTNSIELLGPTRYHWDNGFFSVEIEGRVNSVENSVVSKYWEQLPDKLVMYDYLGCNPSKGGLFRTGPIIKGDGLVVNWLGHSNFEMGNIPLSVRRMPSFFETFPVILVDDAGNLRADIPFRRGVSEFSIEQQNVLLFISGGVLNGSEYQSPTLVKSYARKAQFGEIFSFDKKSSGGDGVFRSSPRGWYSFGHLSLSLLFFLGHIWHAARSLFYDIWTGVSVDSTEAREYGSREKMTGMDSSDEPTLKVK